MTTKKEITVTKTLPAWAEQNEVDGFIEIDPAVVYPMAIELLKLPVDQYGLEVARRCVTTALLDMLGPPLNLRILRNEEWQLDKFKKGKSAELGVIEFRPHYDRIKAKLLS